MCDPILVTLLKMLPHYSQFSRENATPSSSTSPLASYKEAPPLGYLYSKWLMNKKNYKLKTMDHAKLKL